MALDMESLAIRPAVREAPRHPDQQIAVDGPIGFGVMEDAGDATHDAGIRRYRENDSPSRRLRTAHSDAQVTP
jgi:hypothetical protein